MTEKKNWEEFVQEGHEAGNAGCPACTDKYYPQACHQSGCSGLVHYDFQQHKGWYEANHRCDTCGWRFYDMDDLNLRDGIDE